MLCGVNYKAITNEGLWISHDGHDQLLRVDTIVVCAGQESVKDLMPQGGKKCWPTITLLEEQSWQQSLMPSVLFVKELNWLQSFN